MYVTTDVQKHMKDWVGTWIHFTKEYKWVANNNIPLSMIAEKTRNIQINTIIELNCYYSNISVESEINTCEDKRLVIRCLSLSWALGGIFTRKIRYLFFFFGQEAISRLETNEENVLPPTGPAGDKRSSASTTVCYL